MPASKTIEIQSPLYGLEAVPACYTPSWTPSTCSEANYPPPSSGVVLREKEEP